MSIVLRHKISGLYYRGPGRWVRRADNARVFESASAAESYSQRNGLADAQPVPSLAPCLLSMIRRPRPSALESWKKSSIAAWYAEQAGKLSSN